MMSKAMRLVVALMLALLVSAGSILAAPTGESADAQPIGPVNPLPGITLGDLSNRAALNNTMALTDEGMLLAQSGSAPDFGGDVYGFQPKSPRRAFLQSFFIPGWGQWYNGSRIKPFIFLGLEAAGWYLWSDYRGNGGDLEDQYRFYADEWLAGESQRRWDYRLYQEGLIEVYGVEADTMPYNVPGTFDSTYFSHHVLPSDTVEKSDTYYENIGKYDQFAFGWYDYEGGYEIEPGDSTVDYLTPSRQDYLGQRDDANREFNKASTVLILTIGNHLLSAFEAALGAKRYNRSRDQFGTIDADLRLTQTNLSTELAPRLTLRYRF